VSLPFHSEQSPHDLPTAEQMLAAVGDWLSNDLIPTLDGAQRYHARVAANMLSIVGRELQFGHDHRRTHLARLAEFGVADDAELATAIRTGQMDDRLDEVAVAVKACLLDELSVNNPGYTDG